MNKKVGRALVILVFALSGGWSSAAEPDGLYFMTRLIGSSLEMKTWYFRNGRFAEEPRSGLANFDFDAAERATPGSTGTLTLRGDQWTFAGVDGRTQTARFEPSTPPGVCFYWNAGLFCRAKPFIDDQTLAGTFSGSQGSGGVGSARTFRFYRDGHYSMSSSGAIVSPGAVAGSASQERGRYRLAGTSITLRPDGDSPRMLTAFPFEPGADAASPERLYLGGFMLSYIGAAEPISAPTPAPSSTSSQVSPRRALGVQIITREDGVTVRAVAPGSVAEQAGVLPDDMVVAFGNKSIAIGDELIAAVAASVGEERSTLRILRNGTLRTISINWASGMTRSNLAPAPTAAAPVATLSFSENDSQVQRRRFTARVSGVRGALVRAELKLANPSGTFERYRPYSQSDIEEEPYTINTDLASQAGEGHWQFHILRVYRNGALISPDRTVQDDARPMHDEIKGDVTYEIDGGSELVAGRVARLTLSFEDGSQINATTSLTDRWD